MESEPLEARPPGNPGEGHGHPRLVPCSVPGWVVPGWVFLFLARLSRRPRLPSPGLCQPRSVSNFLSGESLRAQLERGREVRALDYQRALARIRPIYESFAELFYLRYDAILTPAAPGTAPKGLATTGDPTFCTLWTLCGMPAVSLPLMQGANGLPLGVQLVGPRDGDARLLRTARWLVARVGAS